MHFHWGFGVGHAYAYNNIELHNNIVDINGLAMNASLLPEISISDCCVDWDRDDMNSQSFASSSDPDHKELYLDNVDVEIAAMYNWDSQDEGDEEHYKF